MLKQRLEQYLTNLDIGNLKHKYHLLLLKVNCRMNWEMSLSEVKELKKLHLTPSEETDAKAIGISLERGHYLLAAHLDKFLLNGKSGQQDLRAYSCYLYFESLIYAQRKALRSVPRALSLFFSVNKENSEGPEVAKLNKIAVDYPNRLPIVIWCHFLEQLFASASHSKEVCRNFVFAVVCRLMKMFPSQIAWYLLPMLSSSQDRVEFARRVLQRIAAEMSGESYARIEASHNVLKAITELAKDPSAKRLPTALLSDFRCNLALPIRSNFELNSEGFPSNPILLIRCEQYLEVIESKARPKKVKFVGSDGISRLFLCKYESGGDMRKEARISNLIQLVNKLLRNDPKASELHLQLPYFCLLAISPMCAVIEWVPQAVTLRSLILKCWRREGFNFDISNLDKQIKAQGQLKTWEFVMGRLRPQLYKYFLETYSDGNSWYEFRVRYTRSLAAWSIFGYIIGLGDRHCDNILLLENGELLFIDFDCVFDMGRTLKVPEMVPFRLTQELVDNLGLFGESGEFMYSSEVMLQALKSMSAELSSAFESFINDPLVVAIKNPELSRSDSDINNTLSIVVSRLKGMRSVSDSTLYPSARVQVQELVARAKDEEVLKRMFPGWMPWM